MPEVWLVQGKSGPEPARRPTQKMLDVLESCESSAERASLVYFYSSQGYVMDNCIDNWGWSYEVTMELRRQYGYTWVPQVGMPNIPIAPGLTWPGGPPYDPKPPIGAILVPEK